METTVMRVLLTKRVAVVQEDRVQVVWQGRGSQATARQGQRIPGEPAAVLPEEVTVVPLSGTERTEQQTVVRAGTQVLAGSLREPVDRAVQEILEVPEGVGQPQIESWKQNG